MSKLKSFFTSTIVGGLLVILPIALFFFTMHWLFGMVQGIIAPLTEVLLKQLQLPQVVADVLVILALTLLCFVVGVIVRTRLGKWVYALVESNLLMKAPGLSLIHI